VLDQLAPRPRVRLFEEPAHEVFGAASVAPGARGPHGFDEVLFHHGQLRLGQPAGRRADAAALLGRGVHGRERTRLRPVSGLGDAEEDGADLLGLIAHDRSEGVHPLTGRDAFDARFVLGDEPRGDAARGRQLLDGPTAQPAQRGQGDAQRRRAGLRHRSPPWGASIYIGFRKP
jgi:hypothetical protein